MISSLLNRSIYVTGTLRVLVKTRIYRRRATFSVISAIYARPFLPLFVEKDKEKKKREESPLNFDVNVVGARLACGRDIRVKVAKKRTPVAKIAYVRQLLTTPFVAVSGIRIYTVP